MNMKFNIRKSFLAQLLMVVAIIGLFAALVTPARAQLTPTTLTNLSGLPAVGIPTAVGTNINIALWIPQGKALHFQTAFAAANTTTDVILMQYKLSTDGTNYSTYPVNYISFAANGTTGVIGETNIPALQLEGARKIMFTVYSNSTARTVYATNITIGWRN